MHEVCTHQSSSQLLLMSSDSALSSRANHCVVLGLFTTLLHNLAGMLLSANAATCFFQNVGTSFAREEHEHRPAFTIDVNPAICGI